MTVPTITLHETRPDVEPGLGALRGYLRDILGRFEGRPGTDDDVGAFMAEYPDDEGLVPPQGVFLLATDAEGAVLGCVGLRHRGPDVPLDAAEVKRMWTAPAARGLGVGKMLLAEVTRRARDAGRSRLVLDTRADLLEARTLYERAGFVETESYNENRHAQVWYALDLR
ncbi:GNAT family N-acetyltransferase [Actinomycetospora sp. OC33-EN08]|uniref:GNAT family N-acetyltransferase n=1 Tax=Actinomycetospora aurantiaca TaxID=3129233 RepID=A0ABU8MMT4_9PSEU